jgi:hypothetical protein
MEQFETDENLVDKNEKKEKISGFHCFVIIFCSIFALFLFYLLFKYLKKGNESDPLSTVDHSK